MKAVALTLLIACSVAFAQQEPFDSPKRIEYRGGYKASVYRQEVEDHRAIMKNCAALEDQFVASLRGTKSEDDLRAYWAQGDIGRDCVRQGFEP